MEAEKNNPERTGKRQGKGSPWRFLFAACAAYGAAELLGNLIAWLLYLGMPDPLMTAGEAASIGIIGGADGPTAIFVTTPGWMHYITPCVLLAVGIWGFLRLSKCSRKENQRD